MRGGTRVFPQHRYGTQAEFQNKVTDSVLQWCCNYAQLRIAISKISACQEGKKNATAYKKEVEETGREGKVPFSVPKGKKK